MHMPTIPGFDLPLTAGSGQCFRFVREAEGFRVIASGRVLRMRHAGGDRYEVDCSPHEWNGFWHDYFDLGRDYQTVHAAVPADDLFLQDALRHAGGLRILRQEPWETLIGFIVSQRKNLPAIQGCMEQMARRFGTQLEEGVHAFPTPQQLAEQSIEALNACGLGYRSRYIQGTARLVASGTADLDAWRGLDDAGLMQALCTLPGVGVKVANCVMLFAYQRMDAFPRDVWILRVEQEHYGGRFREEDYPGIAGILQQYMFCYRRSPHPAGPAP